MPGRTSTRRSSACANSRTRNRGWAATSGRVTGFLDIDLEVGAHYIPPLVALIDRHGIDVATGYRHYLLRQTLADAGVPAIVTFGEFCTGPGSSGDQYLHQILGKASVGGEARLHDLQGHNPP